MTIPRDDRAGTSIPGLLDSRTPPWPLPVADTVITYVTVRDRSRKDVNGFHRVLPHRLHETRRVAIQAQREVT